MSADDMLKFSIWFSFPEEFLFFALWLFLRLFRVVHLLLVSLFFFPRHTRAKQSIPSTGRLAVVFGCLRPLFLLWLTTHDRWATWERDAGWSWLFQKLHSANRGHAHWTQNSPYPLICLVSVAQGTTCTPPISDAQTFRDFGCRCCATISWWHQLKTKCES